MTDTARTCEVCRTPLVGKRSNARFCTDACRARYFRGERPVEGLSAAPAASERGSVADALARFLDVVEASEHPAAAGALALAQRIDSNADGAAGAAAALRQIREVMRDLIDDGPRPADFVDYLAMRRDARHAGYMLDIDEDAIAAIIRVRDERLAARRAAYVAVPTEAQTW